MNPQQLVQQLASSLSPANFKWPRGAQEPVFSRVVIDPDVPGVFHQDVVLPAAFLHVETGRDHPEHPADVIDEQRFTLAIFAANASEQAGGPAVVGGNRDNLGSSRGRGLLELEPLVKAQIFNAVGLQARPRTTGAQPTAYAGKMGGVIAGRALEIVAGRMPSFPSYPSPPRLKANANGPGTAQVQLWIPPARYDFVGVTYVRQAGTTAGYFFDPTGTTNTFIATAQLGTNGITYYFNDTPGAGTWTYSVFLAYDSTVDPVSGVGVVPVAPNAWSSAQSAQRGLVFAPGVVTVTV